MNVSERETVLEPIKKYASEIGWEYLASDEVSKLRKDNLQVVLEKHFLEKVKNLNPFLSEDKAREILKNFETVSPNIEGNFNAWQFLTGMRSEFVEEENRHRNIQLIDTKNIDNNCYHFTEEYSFFNGVRTIRQDLVFFINGIPLVFVEAKAPYNLEGVETAFEQVKRYHRECPELLSLEQCFVLTNLVKFYYGPTWNLTAKSLYSWKANGASSFEELVKRFFKKENLINLLINCILFTRKDDQLNKVILRPHQIRAVGNIVERAKSVEKKRGLIWHTQGSGKTYTMIVAAKRLIEDPLFENPTVLMLVDRNELESQLFTNIKSVGIEHVVLAETKEHLKSILKEDRRGLIVSMIHKFEGMERNINTRDNIFVLIDEAHRTTSGRLADYLMSALPNATYIGFTGTPIDKTSHGRGTFKVFGIDDPPHGYMDKYSIAESIEEGTTVKLVYTFAPNEFQIDKELLEREFFSLKETEGISDVEQLNKIIERSVNLKNAIKSPKRISEIAEFIADHFRDHVEPMGYKAFVVAVDREACALYKQELDKHLPREYTKVIYSQNASDPDFMKEHFLSEEEEKRVRKDFLDPEKNPKILIVTNKLLTGYDAPILYCMYLDKPMRDHVLLQTIARVNRPYEDKKGIKKPAGLVVDFIGIFSNLEKALEFDSADIQGVVDDIQKLKDRFKELIEFEDGRFEELKKFLENPKELKTSDKSLEWIITYFSDDETRREFYDFFKELQNLYNVISPDAFLRPYLERLNLLTKIYMVLRGTYEQVQIVDKELSEKVKKLVQKSVIKLKFEDQLEIYEINENMLNELERKKIPDKVKVFNIVKSIKVHVANEGDKKAYLIPIAEKADKLLEAYLQRQKETKEFLEELKKLIDEINQAEKERAELGLDLRPFSIYWILKKEGIKNPKVLAEKISKTLDHYPYWKTSEHQRRIIKNKIVGMLLRIIEANTKKTATKKTTILADKIIKYLEGFH